MLFDSKRFIVGQKLNLQAKIAFFYKNIKLHLKNSKNDL